MLRRSFEIFREAQDGEQDATFHTRAPSGEVDATIQCKYSSDVRRRLTAGDITPEIASVVQLVAADQADTYILRTAVQKFATEVAG